MSENYDAADLTLLKSALGKFMFWVFRIGPFVMFPNFLSELWHETYAA